ncbi:MAG: hypothetical protein R3202_14780, partial [Candidatus Competibacterales bacterium]|nr:hypothetical protein [Candidatus Competibacterales bacterium]
MSIRDLEQRYDPELQFRPLPRLTGRIVGALLLGLALFHYYTAGFGLLREATHRGIHLALVLGLIFLVFPLRRTGPTGIRPVPWFDWLLALTAAAAALYVPWIFADLAMRVGDPLAIDVVMGTLMIGIVLETARRAMGLAL